MHEDTSQFQVRGCIHWTYLRMHAYGQYCMQMQAVVESSDARALACACRLSVDHASWCARLARSVRSRSNRPLLPHNYR
jgi:hypothetical protein